MTNEDKIASIERCFFEAKYGRVCLALLRMKLLNEEFSKDPDVKYAEGLIRRDFLGQGIKATELFKEAYCHGKNENIGYLAACNISSYSLDGIEFSEWLSIVKSYENSRDDTDYIMELNQISEAIEEGIRLEEFNFDVVSISFENENYGHAASLAEIILHSNYFKDDERRQIELRRIRALSLRKLDAAAQNHLKYPEKVIPDERLALLEADRELEKAIEMDEYDPKLWNYRSAWAVLLKNPENAIKFADKALELDPFNYSKPYLNKAIAYYELKNIGKLTENAEKVLEISDKNSLEANNALNLISNSKYINYQPNNEDIENLVGAMLNLSKIYADNFVNSIKRRGISLSYGSIAHNIQRQLNETWSFSYITTMAELLTTFPPDVLLFALDKLAKKSIKMYLNCLIATIYLLLNSQEEVVKRDSTRLIILLILSQTNYDEMQKFYKKYILAPSVLSQSIINDPVSQSISQLDYLIKKEMEILSINLKKTFDFNEPLDQIEISSAEFMLTIIKDPKITLSNDMVNSTKKSKWKFWK